MIQLFDAVYLELLAVSLRNHHHQNNNNYNNKISVMRLPVFFDVTY
jgi:hypothetical protein